MGTEAETLNLTLAPARSAGEPETLLIDASGLHYRELNQRLREAVEAGARRIELRQVYGQRYLGTDLHSPVEIHIHGTPGNDLASFMDSV
ncbi:MAG: hypothetical protein JW850_15490, partial [Thermoflexales bacterium]|nr:hypothetical protein [Thermoflexales bacterium]